MTSIVEFDLRIAVAADLDACVAVQRASTVVGYAHIFDQAIYAFPAQVVSDEWTERLQGKTSVTIAMLDHAPVGVVGSIDDSLEALFVVPEQWNRRIASQLHDHALAQIVSRGHSRATLDVLAANTRARGFYERRGWLLQGQSRPTGWPPYPELVSYSRDL